MRRPDTFRSRESDLDSMMTPMIDVVFLLLVFFVWTVSTQVIEYVLHSQLTAEIGNTENVSDIPPPEKDFDEIVVKLGWDGVAPSWFINEARINSVELLQQQLDGIAQVKVDAPVILDPDPTVPMEFVIEAYDVSKLAGFQKVSFAVGPQR